MSKIKIDKNDYFRVILSDTLPYEVPINFLNEGFYLHLKNKNSNASKLDQITIDFLDNFLNIGT